MQGLRENKWAYSTFAPNHKGGHPGIDLQYGYQDKVEALFDGRIVYTQFDTVVELCTLPNGVSLEINYGHCSDVKVFNGQEVKQGQEIGRVSFIGPSQMWQENTVLADKIAWSHLHFGIREVEIGSVNPCSYYWDYQHRSIVPYSVKEYDASIEHFIDPSEYNIPVYYLIAQAIERKENYRKYHADTNNPGNIRGTNGKFLKFVSYEEGFDYLCNYINRACRGEHKAYNSDMTMLDFFSKYAPSEDNNNPKKYAEDVCQWVGIPSIYSPISDWLLTQLEWAKKYNYNPYLAYPMETAPIIGSTGVFAGILTAVKRLWQMIFKDEQ